LRRDESASCRGRVGIGGRARRDRVNGMNGWRRSRTSGYFHPDGPRNDSRTSTSQENTGYGSSRRRKRPSQRSRTLRCIVGNTLESARFEMSWTGQKQKTRRGQRMMAGWGKSQKMENQTRLDGLQNVGAKVGHRQEKMEVQVRSNAGHEKKKEKHAAAKRRVYCRDIASISRH